MANTDQAKKAMRSSARRRQENDGRRRALKEAMKAVASAKDNSKEILSKAYQAIDKAVKSGIIKKNTAARRKARVSRELKAKAVK